MSDKEFVDGLIVKPPHEKAPDFVKCSISIKRKDLGNWLRGKSEDWINLDVKTSQNGKWYAEVNTWKPKQENRQPDSNDSQDLLDDGIPF
jgi:hypothetical protein